MYFEKFCGALRGKLRVFTESNSESLREQAKGTKIEGQMVSAAEGNEGKEGGLPQLRPKFELRFPVPEFFTDGNEENEDFRRGKDKAFVSFVVFCLESLRCIRFMRRQTNSAPKSSARRSKFTGTKDQG